MEPEQVLPTGAEMAQYQAALNKDRLFFAEHPDAVRHERAYQEGEAWPHTLPTAQRVFVYRPNRNRPGMRARVVVDAVGKVLVMVWDMEGVPSNEAAAFLHAAKLLGVERLIALLNAHCGRLDVPFQWD